MICIPLVFIRISVIFELVGVQYLNYNFSKNFLMSRYLLANEGLSLRETLKQPMFYVILVMAGYGNFKIRGFKFSLIKN